MALIKLGEADYKIWQQRLATDHWFRYWWQFWSNYSFIFFIAAGLYLLGTITEPQMMILLAAASFAVARLVVTVLINLVYEKKRPYQQFNFDPIISRFFSWKKLRFHSFPSRHSIAFAAVAVSISVFNPAIGLCLLAVTMLTGMGRVVLGFHWPADILGGLILGSVTGYVVTTVGLAVFFT